jgi:hypothetical protein
LPKKADSGKPWLVRLKPEPQANVAVITEASVPLDGISCGVAVTSRVPTLGAWKVKLFVPSTKPPLMPPLKAVDWNEIVTVAVPPVSV